MLQDFLSIARIFDFVRKPKTQTLMAVASGTVVDLYIGPVSRNRVYYIELPNSQIVVYRDVHLLGRQNCRGRGDDLMGKHVTIYQTRKGDLYMRVTEGATP